MVIPKDFSWDSEVKATGWFHPLYGCLLANGTYK
jgi:hypothetical protein